MIITYEQGCISLSIVLRIYSGSIKATDVNVVFSQNGWILADVITLDLLCSFRIKVKSSSV